MRFWCKQLANGRWGIYKNTGSSEELLASVADRPTAQYLAVSLSQRNLVVESLDIPQDKPSQPVPEESAWQQQVLIPPKHHPEPNQLAQEPPRPLNDTERQQVATAG